MQTPFRSYVRSYASFVRKLGSCFVSSQPRCVVRLDAMEVRRFVVTQWRCVGVVGNNRSLETIVSSFFTTQRRCVVLRDATEVRRSSSIDGTLPPDNFLNNVEFTYSINSCVVYRLELLESYGHYLTTAPASTGGPSNHVTGKYCYLVALPTHVCILLPPIVI